MKTEESLARAFYAEKGPTAREYGAYQRGLRDGQGLVNEALVEALKEAYAVFSPDCNSGAYQRNEAWKKVKQALAQVGEGKAS